MIPVESIVRYLIKFGSEKNMKSLLDGKVFMHNLQYYINLEKEKGDQITGDEYEGKLPVVNVTLSIRNPDTHEHRYHVERHLLTLACQSIQCIVL